jgi:hypothetical protein
MKKICMAIAGIVLALVFSGCESRHETLAKELKFVLKCGNLKFPLPDFVKDRHFQYYEEITKMSASEYNKLIKAMGCNPEAYSLEVQIEENKNRLAELEKEYAEEGEYIFLGIPRSESIKKTKQLIKELESK